jgi:FkbM family methyltransferase
MPIKTYIFKEYKSYSDMKKMEGEYFDKFGNVIDHDADVYIEHDNVIELLFHFRKNVIPVELLENALSVFKDDVKHASSVRGSSGGKVTQDKLSNNIEKVLNPNAFKSKVLYKDGHTSNYYVANKANSMIAGYFDKPKVSDKHDVIKHNKIPCRVTKFTEEKKTEWNSVLPLIYLANDYYKQLEPNVYKEQYAVAKSVPEFHIKKTAFSTMTINYNWRTACHIDSGDYHNGLSVILVASHGNFKGGYLGYPQYDVCVDVRQGDLLLKNPHQWHCNTPIIGITKDWTRLSMILYYREGILKCANDNMIDDSSKIKLKGSKLEGSKLEKIKLEGSKLEGSKLKGSKSEVSKLEGSKLEKIKLEKIKLENNKYIYVRKNTTDVKVIDEILIKQVYQKQKINFFIEPGQLWFDMGGNIGIFSIWAINQGAKTIIYEPEPENLYIMQLNLDGYDNYKIIPCAISNQSGILDLYLCKGEYNKYRHTLYKKRGRKSIKVRVLNFHDEMNIYKPYGIKMDIEGSEIAILESVKSSDWKKWNTQKIVFEYSFDIDNSIPRFMNIIKQLEKYWTVVYYTKVKETELEYNYFPAMTIVYCMKI